MANKFLNSLTEDTREEYLTKNNWITWKDKTASFTFSDYVAHVGRMKGLPAFDDFNKTQPETILFGNKTINARHFTDFSIQYTSNNNINIDEGANTLVNMMNALHSIEPGNNGCAHYWWLRNGTSDNHTSQTVMINLATSLENQNMEVDTWLFWDGGLCADDDPEGFVESIGYITGYDIHSNTRR